MSFAPPFLRSKLAENGKAMAVKIIVIDGYIGPYAYSKQFIRNELAGNSKNPVTVKISSLGGALDDAINIHDQFQEHGNVTAELSAFVASSATIISLGAKTVRMNENSFYLIHKAMNLVDEWSAMNEDQIDELISKLEAQKQELAKITLQMAKMYVKKTGKALSEILNLMKQETWLTAEEAKTWGFVDEISVTAEAVNYLDNLQMVAMITSSGYPAPPRKNLNQGAASQGPENSQIANPIDEESLFERFWNKIRNKQQEFTPKNKVAMKKQFLNVNQVLAVENLESTDEGVYLNETQLQQIEDRLSLDQQIVAERDTAISERNSITAERDTARTELTNALDPFNAIDPTIASATTPEAKVQAIRTLLAAKPGVAPALALGADPVNVKFDGFTAEEKEITKNL